MAGDHHEQDGVLAHVPVISRENILAALHENHVENGLLIPFALRDVVGNAIGARIQVHLMQVRKRVHIGHDATGERRVLEVVQDAVHLIELALAIARLLGDLVAVGLAN